MAAIPSTVDIDCPRPSCEDHVTCALETVQLPPKPGAKPSISVRITDLADRMAEHYAAEHGYLPGAPQWVNALQSGFRDLAYAGQAAGASVLGMAETLADEDVRSDV